MGNQPTEVNTSKQQVDMNQNPDRQNIETEQGARSGSNKQSPNVTGAGETSRSANQDDIGNPKANTQDIHRGRETGRPDTDMDSELPGSDS